jgi:7,8-dihydroneopterin aldolase/epimerase/oxygenase
MTDCIYLSGLRTYGYTGFFSEEQTLGQWYELDLTLWLDLSKSGESDCLQDTYDYSSDVKAVQELIKTARFRLLEKLATAIADIMLRSSQVEQVKVRLTKCNPPIPDFAGKVAVEITRTAASLS